MNNQYMKKVHTTKLSIPPFLLTLILIMNVGCGVSIPESCKKWRDEGDFFVTEESCARCYEQFGNNRGAVQGCGIGLDINRILR